MDEISKFYGNLSPIKENNERSEPSISYQPKEKQQVVPEGAKIKSSTKNIYVSEIENGYLVSFDTQICYLIKESDGDEEERYIYNNRRIFTKEKPLDIKLSM